MPQVANKRVLLSASVAMRSLGMDVLTKFYVPVCRGLFVWSN